MTALTTLVQNRYDRTEFGGGMLGWVYEYRNAGVIRKVGALATGLEFAVQLRGTWVHGGARTGSRLYEPRMVHVISPAESYEYEFRAPWHESGLQVGFIVYPDEIDGFASIDSDVVFQPRVAIDARFLDFCRVYQVEHDRGNPLPAHQSRSEILRWARASVDFVSPDPMLCAKREIDRTFAQPLYVKHLAEIARVKSSVVFSRKFARRFGITPVAYRIKLRLNQAARLSWTRPDLSISAISKLVGFDDESYFHRAFVASHGLSPAQYGRRGLRRPSGLRL